MKERMIQFLLLLISGYVIVLSVYHLIPKPERIDPNIMTVPVGMLNITAYQPKVEQTDASPWSTSIGERVTIRGCAVSQELLAQNGGPLHYGDLVYIEDVGFRFVNDCMHPRIKRGLDLWVPNKKEESKVYKKFRNSARKVSLVIRIGDQQ